MAIEWLKSLLESEEERNARIIKEFTDSGSFQDVVKHTASEMLRQEREAEKQRQIEEKEREAAELEESKKHIERVADSMQNSTEPFINIVGMGFTPEQGLSVKLDYNAAFIRYLNKAGIKAANDEETVRLWLAHLNYDISQEMLAEDYLLNGITDDDKSSLSFDEMFPPESDEEDDR